MELVPALGSKADAPTLTTARLRRQLTVDRAARIARLTPEEVMWLEDGRLYRFPSSDSAVLALLLYATALGIGRREARQLAGLPVLPQPKLTDRVSRTAAAVAAAAVLTVVGAALVVPGIVHGSRSNGGATAADAGLPPTWRISVDVLNGSGDMNYTRRVASRIGAMAYRIERVARADRFDYPATAVFFHTGGQQVAERLARELGVQAKPLPGGTDAYRLVVVVGPARI